ncbi:hypothetical protein KP509_28G028700 [Ceratopteris richardii]|uniref:Uncharacterized protein n=1 Tax=Ceratopteris richardii TaxID=49495 RepID=A0A8T2RC01_CERRI|nr:hypothetical protein KP509_28G028700 [Ceratopteris richardii]
MSTILIRCHILQLGRRYHLFTRYHLVGLVFSAILNFPEPSDLDSNISCNRLGMVIFSSPRMYRMIVAAGIYCSLCMLRCANIHPRSKLRDLYTISRDFDRCMDLVIVLVMT